MLGDAYCVLGGSRAHGMEVSGSDHDLLLLDSSCAEWPSVRRCVDGYNVISMAPEALFHALYDRPLWCALQWVFPREWKSDGGFSDFMRENGERVIYGNLPHVRATMEQKIGKIRQAFPGFCAVSRKMTAYAFLFLCFLRDLPQGKPVADCIRPSGELHDFLLDIRSGAYTTEFLWDAFQRLEAEKDREAAFFDAPRDEAFFAELKAEMGKYSFLPYVAGNMKEKQNE